MTVAKTVALFLTRHGKTLFVVLPIVKDFVIAGADHVRHETRDRLDLPHEHVAKPGSEVRINGINRKHVQSRP